MQNSGKYVMCIISVPEEKADALAGLIVREKLAACAQVTGKIKSFYWWDNKVNIDPEVLIYLKTMQEKVPVINNFLKEHHPYQVPEFIVLPLIAGNPAYFQWIEDIVNG